jgi:shikimate kinase
LERIILVGGMCSGKSTVGRLVAERLKWSFIDFDESIERSECRTVAQIFRDCGEPRFRALEAELTAELERKLGVVLAPGGGWITQPDLMERLRPGSFVVWLRVSPETAWDRHRQQSSVERPLLSVEDPLKALRAILAERGALYARADAIVDTDGRDPQTVAEEVVAALNLRRPADPAAAHR